MDSLMQYLQTGAYSYVVIFLIFGVVHGIEFFNSDDLKRKDIVAKKSGLDNLVAWVLFLVSLHIIVDLWM